MICWAVLASIIVMPISGIVHRCDQDSECGWYSQCRNGTCVCESGFTRTSGVDCRNKNCTDPQCLHCHGPEHCVRCANFMEENSRTCIDACQGLYHISVQGDVLGRICPDYDHFHADRLHFTEVVSIVCGVFIPVVMIILLCIRARMVGRLALLVDDISGEDLQTPSRKRFVDPVFETYLEPFYDENSMPPGSRVHFTQLVCDLKMHSDDLKSLVREMEKAKEDEDLERIDVEAYDNIISHLWRVITIVNKFNPVFTMPADGCELLLWAKQLLDKYLQHRRDLAARGKQLPLQLQSCLVMGYMANDDDYTFHVSYV